jgi:hypothetical protein
MSNPVRNYFKDKLLPKLAWHVQYGTFVERIVHEGWASTKPGLEPVYQRIFERDLEQVGAANTFYPVGSAANYSLLYFILRVAREVRPSSVLELGAGQTSLLFDKLRRCGVLSANVLTIEHDRAWADSIRERVSHEVRLLKLKPCEDDGLSYQGYDFGDVTLLPTIDFLVVDGPPGATREQRYSRHGCLVLLDRLDPEGFIVVIDDVERRGEALLCERIERSLQAKHIAFRRSRITANKQQAVFASGRFSHAAFY